MTTYESVWQEVWATIQGEFSDVADAADVTRILVRLGMAALLGGVIGYEREARGKPAGLRTHMVVALGAALFVLIPVQMGMEVRDLSRVYQGVIAGIGFLGAGAIIKMSDRQEVHGLTTAASIWFVAAVGVAAGMGLEITAILATTLVWITLAFLRRLEDHIEPSDDEVETSPGAKQMRREAARSDDTGAPPSPGGL
ncbi:MgtC/SapB family protein [Pusillimonas sp. TS35]|jgi:putative Mg2+ transporter-C (MgtC) family protein|uniref:MgtC/SapB family protein n=1 Tax=Paracandidimonas lactea TaxID=2895524 RepID=UPI0013720DCB|nr:MgtC/SapB family protein [Paracandidimonas lactea]MYN15091.1 MgtC/SapB family protein [Pusillimonas sp. TS35]